MLALEPPAHRLSGVRVMGSWCGREWRRELWWWPSASGGRQNQRWEPLAPCLEALSGPAHRHKFSCSCQQSPTAVRPSQAVVCARSHTEEAGIGMKQTTMSESGRMSLNHGHMCDTSKSSEITGGRLVWLQMLGGRYCTWTWGGRPWELPSQAVAAIYSYCIGA